MGKTKTGGTSLWSFCVLRLQRTVRRDASAGSVARARRLRPFFCARHLFRLYPLRPGPFSLFFRSCCHPRACGCLPTERPIRARTDAFPAPVDKRRTAARLSMVGVRHAGGRLALLDRYEILQSLPRSAGISRTAAHVFQDDGTAPPGNGVTEGASQAEMDAPHVHERTKRHRGGAGQYTGYGRVGGVLGRPAADRAVVVRGADSRVPTTLGL